MRADQPGLDDPDTPDGSDARGAADAVARPKAAPASRAEQIAAGLRYRETVAAADRDAGKQLDDRSARTDGTTWTDAVAGLRAAWAEHKQRYPEQARAVPRTEADGAWSCGPRRLDPEQNTEAGKAHADLADEADRHILPALRRIESADPDRKLAGLEHMIKGEDRLKDKLADILLVDSRLTARQALAKVSDAVRFTLTYSSERYTQGVAADVSRLKAEGFELIKLKNLWDADQYKGVNSQWRNRETGTRLEMQFHTSHSLEVKELTHEAYERLRRPAGETSQVERNALENFQRRANSTVDVPPGVDRIKNFPEAT